jgi:hypothetical protein
VLDAALKEWRTASGTDFVCHGCNFIVDLKFYWQSMKTLKYRLDVFNPPSVRDDASETVLCSLQLRNVGISYTKQYGVGMVKPQVDQCAGNCFSCIHLW